jgi:MFS transporter, DHA3 family, macrolide efflux protein
MSAQRNTATSRALDLTGDDDAPLAAREGASMPLLAAPRSEPRATSVGETLWTRNFRLLWSGSLLSEIGTVSTAMAVMIWTQEATGSSLSVGLLIGCSALPAALLAPLGGAFADRFDRRKILVGCDCLSGALMLTQAAVFARGGEAGVLLVTLAVMAFGLGLLASLFRPTITACIPDTVPASQLAAANGWYGSAGALARITGYAAAGTAYAALGAAGLFTANALTFLASALLESRMSLRAPARSASVRARWRSDLADAFRYMTHNRGMQQLFIAAGVLNFLLNPVTVLLPSFVERTLGLGPTSLGYLLSSFATGAVCGFTAAGSLSRRGISRRSMIALGWILEPLLLAALGMTRSAASCMLVLGALGAVLGLLTAATQTALQLATPVALRGRVFGMFHTLVSALAPVSFALAGILGELLEGEVGPVFVGSGIVMAALVLWLVTRPQLSALLSIPTPPAARHLEPPR